MAATLAESIFEYNFVNKNLFISRQISQNFVQLTMSH